MFVLRQDAALTVYISREIFEVSHQKKMKLNYLLKTLQLLLYTMLHHNIFSFCNNLYSQHQHQQQQFMLYARYRICFVSRFCDNNHHNHNNTTAATTTQQQQQQLRLIVSDVCYI